MAPSHGAPCLARLAPEALELMRASLAAIDQLKPVIVPRLKVSELGLLAPSLLVVDVDGLEVDPLETLRMLRFALPHSMIAVYTNGLSEGWAFACHLAGANCLLSKSSNAVQVSAGLHRALQTGCFTDQVFEASQQRRDLSAIGSS
jgi:DNA-binding NarL/FixJ family response regulator